MFVITFSDKMGTWYFKQFQFGFPVWVGIKKLIDGEVRTFDTKAEARAFIKGMLDNRRKFGIEEI